MTGLFIVGIGSARADTTFTATLTAAQEVPPANSSATGVGTLILNDAENQVTATISFAGLSSTQTGAHIHSPAARGQNASVIRQLPSGSPATITFPVSFAEQRDLQNGLWYFSVSSENFAGGEIRGQLEQLCTPPPPGLVAFYKGEGNPNDSTTFASHGSMRNGASFGAGVIGQGFKLDSVDDFVAFSDEDHLDLAGELTIAAWIRPDVSSGRQQVIVSKRSLDGGTVDYALFLESDGRLAFTSRITSGAFATVYANAPDGPFATDRFTHVGVTIRDSTLRFYINGSSEGTVGNYPARAASAGRVTVGAVELSTGNSAHFGGVIDELQLFNHAAGSGQILRIWQNVTTGVCTASAPFPNVAGTLDRSFDRDGKIVAPSGVQTGALWDVAMQPDGKIVTVGSAAFSQTGADFMVLRFNASGTPDTTFHGDSGTDSGAVRTHVFTNDVAHGVALQADGKIVVAGTAADSNGSRAALARYNPDGTLDQTFVGDSGVGDGKITSTLSPGARDLTIQPDGRIIVVGSDASAGIVVIRFEPDGKVDPSFGTGGRVATAIGELTSANAVALQPDGKIVVVGNGATPGLPASQRFEFAIARYNPDGTLDITFDGDSGTGNGRFLTPISSFDDAALDVAIQPDGKIILAGATRLADGSNDTVLLRYHPDGTLDTSFGGDGIVVTPVSAGLDFATSVALQADGRIVAAASAVAGGNLDFAILRYNPDGSLDPSFDGDSGVGDGKVLIPIGTGGDFAERVALANGHIVAVGRLTLNDGGGAVVRLHANSEFTDIDNSTAAFVSNVAASGSTVATPLTSNALPPLPAGINYISGSIITDLRTSAAFDGDVFVRFRLPASIDQQTFDRLVLLQFENGAWVDRTISTPDTPARDFATHTIYGRAASLSPWVVAVIGPGSGDPTRLANISTRLRVEAGENVLIGGIIVTGAQPKKVIVRAIGPSTGLPGALADPQLSMVDGAGNPIAFNDNWEQAFNAQEIIASTIAPNHPLEAAFLSSLSPGAYTAVVSGVNGGTGIGLVEVYDLDRAAGSQLANIATRGRVQPGDDVMIGGLIVTGASAQRVIVRAIAPSLPVDGKLEDPLLELVDGNGNLITSNNNWRENQQAEIEATTIPPTNDLESAIVTSLAPAAYTAVVRGVNETTGIALVEVYRLD